MASCVGATFQDGGRFGMAPDVWNRRAMASGGREEAKRPHMGISLPWIEHPAEFPLSSLKVSNVTVVTASSTYENIVTPRPAVSRRLCVAAARHRRIRILSERHIRNANRPTKRVDKRTSWREAGSRYEVVRQLRPASLLPFCFQPLHAWRPAADHGLGAIAAAVTARQQLNVAFAKPSELRASPIGRPAPCFTGRVFSRAYLLPAGAPVS